MGRKQQQSLCKDEENDPSLITTLKKKKKDVEQGTCWVKEDIKQNDSCILKFYITFRQICHLQLLPA